MMLLFLAAVLPWLFWDQGPETAARLQEAGITRVAVPQRLFEQWSALTGFSVRSAGEQTIKLPAPGVQYRVNEASATRTPWIDSNGWRMLRKPDGLFLYEAPGPAAALSAAEAHMWGAEAIVRTDEAGLKPLGEMFTFLSKLSGPHLDPVADIGFVDDGSPQAGEALNMMIRRNLLVRVVAAPDDRSPLTVPFGSDKYPRKAAANPAAFAQKIRYEVTDERRSIRVYGSDVVIARSRGNGNRLRIFLLNYAAPTRDVEGVRVRIRGEHSQHTVYAAGVASPELMDVVIAEGFTEFTLPRLTSYAVVDLLPGR
jgi:hypothetical protein